jgi:hypothetical protein
MRGVSAIPAVVAAMALCVGARAEPPALGLAPAEAGADYAQRLALAERYLTDAHGDRTVQVVFEEALKIPLRMALRQMNDGIPSVPETIEREMYGAVAATARAAAPRLHERMARLLAAEHTTAQLQALVDSCDTPEGRAFAEKSPDVSAVARRVAYEMVSTSTADAIRRFCARETQCGIRQGLQTPG